MRTVISIIVVIGCVVLGIFGYAFELAYFLTLGLRPGDHLSLWHYLVSALQIFLPIFIALAVGTQLTKFLSKKKFEQDDAQDTRDWISKTPLANIVGFARLMLGISLVFFVLSYLAHYLGYRSIWAAGSYLIFMVFGYFSFALVKSPPQSRPSVFVALLIAESFMFAALGLGQADDAIRQNRSPVRDDWVVTIKRGDGRFIVEPKALPFAPAVVTLARKFLKF
jgi:uncharacterized membrane protein